MTPNRREWTIGENTFLFEPPDLLRATYRGPCSLREAKQVVELCQELGTVRPFYMLGDMEEAGAMDGEARRYFSEHFQAEWLLEMISYKTRLRHRALIMGLRLALEMTRSEENSLLAKLHFVSTREKAEALLGQLRARTR
jgi:hypothetical protein